MRDAKEEEYALKIFQKPFILYKYDVSNENSIINKEKNCTFAMQKVAFILFQFIFTNQNHV